MKKILLAGLLLLLLSVPSLAAEKELDGIFFPLPEGWQVAEEYKAGGGEHMILDNGDSSVLLSVSVAPDGGTSARDFVTVLAPVLGATDEPVEHEGQYGFAIRQADQEGFCFLTQGGGRFLVLCVMGDMEQALPIVEGMRCPAAPALVIK